LTTSRFRETILTGVLKSAIYSGHRGSAPFFTTDLFGENGLKRARSKTISLFMSFAACMWLIAGGVGVLCFGAGGQVSLEYSCNENCASKLGHSPDCPRSACAAAQEKHQDPCIDIPARMIDGADRVSTFQFSAMPHVPLFHIPVAIPVEPASSKAASGTSFVPPFDLVSNWFPVLQI